MQAGSGGHPRWGTIGKNEFTTMKLFVGCFLFCEKVHINDK
jgi:hypothetical protein